MESGDNESHDFSEDGEDGNLSVILDEDEVLEVVSFEEEAGGSDVNNDQEEIMDEAEEDVPVDDAVAKFLHHQGDVFSVDFGPGLLAASGGEDDKAFLWNWESGDSVLECSGHSDSVTWVRFNAKKTLLASGDMSGRIAVWRISDLDKIAEFDDLSDLEWLLWHNSADILLAGASDGSIWMWLIPTRECRVFGGGGSACSAGLLLQDGKRLLSGYSDGVVRLWDLKSGDSTKIGCQQQNEVGSVTCLDCQSAQQMAAFASVNGILAVFSVETCKVGALFQIPPVDAGDVSDKNSEELNSVEALRFNFEGNLLATGSVNGRLDIWDLNAGIIKQTCAHSNGVVKALWTDNFVIFTACLDGVVRSWDCRSGQVIKQWTGHKAEILDFTLSQNLDYLLTGAADKTCRLFRI